MGSFKKMDKKTKAEYQRLSRRVDSLEESLTFERGTTNNPGQVRYWMDEIEKVQQEINVLLGVTPE